MRPTVEERNTSPFFSESIVACTDKTYYNAYGPIFRKGDVSAEQDAKFIVERIGNEVFIDGVDDPFKAIYTILDPAVDLWPFVHFFFNIIQVEVADTKSVKVKILRVWENVTPNAKVDYDPQDESYVLDNSENYDIEHFFCNELNVDFEVKLN